MVKKGIITTPRETPDMGNIEIQVMQIHFPLGKIDNIYRHQSMTSDRDKATALLNKDHVIVLEDLNSHHLLWGSPQADTAGKNDADILTISTAVIINTGQCTHKDGGRHNLAIVSPDLEHQGNVSL